MKKYRLIFVLISLLLAACSQQATPNNFELVAQAGSWQKVGGALDFTVEKNAWLHSLFWTETANL